MNSRVNKRSAIPVDADCFFNNPRNKFFFINAKLVNDAIYPALFEAAATCVDGTNAP